MRPWLLSFCVALVCLGALLATSPMLPMAWDEGNAIERAAGISQWFADLRTQGIAELSPAAIARRWHYTVEIEGHPALYGVVIALGQLLAVNCAPPLTAARLGPMLLFALAAAAMFCRLRREYSLAVATSAVAALLTMPRVFAHAHFASFDGPLTSFWILAWAIFPPTHCASHEKLTRRFAFLWSVLWGVALGATMSCKFSGWLAVLPFVGYAVVYGDLTTAKTIAIGFTIAILTFWFVNPRLWHHPVQGIATFFELNLNRAGTGLDIPTLFFGRRYYMGSPLPWYNTLVWTAITVPLGILMLAFLGMAKVLRQWKVAPHGVLIFGNWLVLIAARALPGTPVHDAERLILPSFAFLAVLAGIGAGQVLECAPPLCPARRLQSHARHGAMVILIAMYVAAAGSLIWYSPQWLSYYNVLIGGLRGADTAGMEATYYCDALDGEVLDWLHQHTGEGERIDFAVGSGQNFALMQRWGLLRREWRRSDEGEYRWYVLQRRPALWKPRDRWLVEHESPAFSKTIRPASWGLGPWRLDVPLILVYSTEQRERADAAVVGGRGE